MGKERWASVNRWRSAARMITAIMTRVKVKTGNGNGRRAVLAKPKGHKYTRSWRNPFSAKVTIRHSGRGANRHNGAKQKYARK